MRARRGLVVALFAVLAAVAAPGARADDPPLVNWPAVLPALASGITPSTFATCPDGSPRCLDRTLRELDRRLVRHDLGCSDNALFLRNYRLVTRFYQRFAGTGFFREDRWVAREDAIFAELYFHAEDAWRAGRRDEVPEAWRIAFDAADRRAVQGAGNLLLGINAHVQRDQPYMTAGLGLVDAHGRSRKPDHDKFNELLNTAYDDVYAQAMREDDPDLAMYEVPGTQADNLLAFQTIAARTDAERRLVAASIERNAAEWAKRIRDSFPYAGPITRERRDALCATRRARARRAAARREAASGRGRGRGCRVSVRRRGRRIAVRCARRIAIARRAGHRRCRFVTPNGRLSRARSCRRRTWLRSPAPNRFLTPRLPRGRYLVWAPRRRAVRIR